MAYEVHVHHQLRGGPHRDPGGRELYGTTSTEYKAVQDVWAGVAVGSALRRPAVAARRSRATPTAP
ncbi:hypothetical protein SGLAM104S_07358 [Streptomyces glaucescens]